MVSVAEAILKVGDGESVDLAVAKLYEGVFSHTAVAAGAAAFGARMAPQMARLPQMRNRPRPPSGDHINTFEQGMLELTDDIIMMLRDAHVRANDSLHPYGLRYEIQGQFPRIMGLVSRAANVDLAIQIRDTQFHRRLTQIIRYRISMRRASGSVSVRVMDPKMDMTKKKVVFSMDPEKKDFQLHAFEDKLTRALVDRARSAFRR